MQNYNFSLSEEKSYFMIRPLETGTISLIGLAESDWHTNFESIKRIGEIVRIKPFFTQLEFLIGLFLSHNWTTKFAVFYFKIFTISYFVAA